MKKLTALFLSLLMCLSLLPGTACAAGDPDPDQPPVVVEPLDPEDPGDPGDPDDPENPIMPLSMPEDEGRHHTE